MVFGTYFFNFVVNLGHIRPAKYPAYISYRRAALLLLLHSSGHTCVGPYAQRQWGENEFEKRASEEGFYASGEFLSRTLVKTNDTRTRARRDSPRGNSLRATDDGATPMTDIATTSVIDTRPPRTADGYCRPFYCRSDSFMTDGRSAPLSWEIGFETKTRIMN